uniref:G_PROTEIN_RECEP_F1_2 domain-containing protein n=1 Tax=Rhabditophanes sp. KR3021 TaxID=114890 RepID=A0AC35TSK9_9BILA
MFYENNLWNLIFNNFSYDCSYFNETILNDPAKKHPYIGWTYILLAIIFYIVYIPFVIAMTNREIIKFACYKIMIMLGIIDLINLSICGIATGIMSINGYVYCSSPKLIFVLGSVGTAFWVGTAICVTLLSINRCLDFTYPLIGDILFKGSKMWIWLSICPFVMFYIMFFTPPALFSGWLCTWLFDYSFNYFPDKPEKHSYGNIYHTITNFGICISQVLIYGSVFVIFFFKFYVNKTKSAPPKNAAIRLFVQCFLISGNIVLTALMSIILKWTKANLFFKKTPNIIFASSKHDQRCG